MKCDARLPEVLSLLASQNTVQCSESDLRSSIEAARWQRLFKEIADRFHNEDAFSATNNAAAAAVDARAVTSSVWPAYKEREIFKAFIFTSVSASATLVWGSRFSSSVCHLDYGGCVAKAPKVPKMSDMLRVEYQKNALSKPCRSGHLGSSDYQKSDFMGR